jgi:hypothetical protein
MAATCHINGKPIVAWTRTQLENMGRAQLRNRATDLAEAFGVEQVPRHSEVCIDWMLEMQKKLPLDDVVGSEDPESYGRTSRLEMEERRPHDTFSETGVSNSEHLDANGIASFAKQKNRGYGDLLTMTPREELGTHLSTAAHAQASLPTMYEGQPLNEPPQQEDPTLGMDRAHAMRSAAIGDAAANLPGLHGLERAGLVRPPYGRDEAAAPSSPLPAGRGDDAASTVSTNAEMNKTFWRRNVCGNGNVISWS